ncbi:hypothetical protein [Escherichia coli]|jgi:hypothetical protein|uniref:hypothetical protein n=1 Tax=Escherichia coli TaxID=562 RepID=UPI001FCE5D8B|nr:hypothetical protein [Escherichia coli]
MLKKILVSCWIILGLYGVAAIVELQVWRNAKTYPIVLTKPLSVPYKISGANLEKTVQLFDQVCGKDRGLMAIDTKDNGVFMRCDDGLVTLPWKINVYKLKLADGTDYKDLSFL